MSGVHVHPGDRAYLPSSDSFADVTRDSLLGLSKGCVVRSDDGKLRAFCGSVASSVVEKTSGKDGAGNTVTVPTDVKVVGPAILGKLGVSEADQFTLFHKFIALDPSVRREKAAFWEEHQYDDEALATFIPEVLRILESDEAYIQQHSAKLLAHVTDDIRTKMITNMEARTTGDIRKGLIVRFTLIQNDKIQLEEFRQSLFSLLLDDVSYARIEMTRSLLSVRGATQAGVDKQLDEFLDIVSDDTLSEFVSNWRSMKYYTTAARKAGARKVQHLMKKASQV
ncbi:unnamed protein product [Ectocarpus sp. 6 AP-2014]